MNTYAVVQHCFSEFLKASLKTPCAPENITICVFKGEIKNKCKIRYVTVFIFYSNWHSITETRNTQNNSLGKTEQSMGVCVYSVFNANGHLC